MIKGAGDSDRRHQRHVDGRNRRRADRKRRRGVSSRPGPSATFPYPLAVAQRLRAVVADLSEAQAPQLELERLVTDAHVAAVEAFLDRFSIRPRTRRACRPAWPDDPASAARRPDAAALRRRARGGGAQDRRGLGLSFSRRRRWRRRRAAGAHLSCGDGRGPRAAADDPQLGRRRQRHLSWREGRDHRLRHRPGQCADRRLSHR